MGKNNPTCRLAWALVCVLALASAALAQEADIPAVECGVAGISKHGNIVLDISGNALFDLGYAYADLIAVDIAGQQLEMPIVGQFSEVDNGALACAVNQAESVEQNTVTLAINMGDLTTWLGLATKEAIDEDPGFRWNYADAYADGVTVTISMKERGAYADQILIHQLVGSNDRADYPDLTDEQFANFRVVATTGMGKNALYRSSSPVNPKYNRNRQADAATSAAGIRTVVNLADSEQAMKGYEGYAYTYYAQLDIIALDMVVDYASEAFRSSLAEGFRFVISHEGPYLVHCNEGKNRAGFACAMLECLMGATADEVVADYMVSYYNYYGVEPGTEQYETIANSNIRDILANAFGIEDIAAEGVDLAACAEAYMQGIGLGEGEIAALKARLGNDIT